MLPRHRKLLKISIAASLTFMLGYLSYRILELSVSHIDLAQEEETFYTNLTNSIYQRAKAESEVAFRNNGSVKDATQISLGHGSKIRLWDYFGPNFNCVSKERVGRIGDGGKWLCGVSSTLLIKPKCVVYSIGSKGEVSFEVGIKTKLPHCEIHIFDPTLTREQKSNIHSLVPSAHLHEVGLGAADGEMKIKRRRIVWVQKTNAIFEVRKLSTLMSILGHKWIDVLKIDIEGGEWGVFEAIFRELKFIPVTQLQIELHFLGDVEPVLSFFKNMEKRGFRAFSVEPNYYGRTAENARVMVEYSFIHTDSNGKVFWNM